MEVDKGVGTEAFTGVNISEKGEAVAVAGATADAVIGKCPRGTSKRSDPTTSGDFRDKDAARREDDAEERRENATVDGGEERSKDTGRPQQEGRGNPSTTDDAEERSEDTSEEEGKEDCKNETSQQQEGRGDLNKKEDAEEVKGDTERLQHKGRDYATVDEKKQRRKLGAGRGEPDIRTPSHVPGGTWLHRVRSYFFKVPSIETRGMRKGKGED
ncbi:hypothetical protein NDU88_004596 [Pleurodeles waltl]|uniref:Uncharacterized protein n=1 Tax=Pleurodeles waltl TaxID=8319 RepID=A0AAV7W746_PLEWA|nr:hypothetical protein NDU88_004596 [Pleurodeles waltl]